MRRFYGTKHLNVVRRYAAALAAFAMLFTLFEPLIPQCSMMVSGDCAMTETQNESEGCGDCPPAICVISACTATAHGAVLSTIGSTDFSDDKLASLDRATEDILTGRVIRPPGHPPKA